MRFFILDHQVWFRFQILCVTVTFISLINQIIFHLSGSPKVDQWFQEYPNIILGFKLCLNLLKRCRQSFEEAIPIAPQTSFRVHLGQIRVHKCPNTSFRVSLIRQLRIPKILPKTFRTSPYRRLSYSRNFLPCDNFGQNTKW